MFDETDVQFMQQALSLAKLAAAQGEVPVGAILVLNKEVIGEGYNRSISANDPGGHAELVALRAGAQAISNYRLLNTTLYVTLEPCMMCAGALVHARIKRLVYGAADAKTEIITSQMGALNAPFLNHHVHHEGGLLAPLCGEIV